jgi:hypothetical protein
MMFDPAKKPRLPQAVENALREREAYFDPRIGQDEDGFTLEDAESLGWNVGLNHASKPFPGRGQVEVRSYEFGEGRYGVLKEIYDYELAEHQRTQARARGLFERLVREERLQLKALDAATAVRDETPSFGAALADEEWVALKAAHERESGELGKAIRHAREALQISGELDAFGLLELPDEYINELREERDAPLRCGVGLKASMGLKVGGGSPPKGGQ